MSTTIRLSRIGAKKEYRYRIVVSPKRSKIGGQALEVLGSYDPLQAEGKQVTLDVNRYNAWIKKGALASRTVSSIFKKLA
jgi:small subunit ribosomal protein S16